MAGKVFEGRTNVYWATAIADVSAPTVSEITAATDITAHVTKDGVSPNITNNDVDTASINSTFDSKIVGSDGADLTLKLKRGDATGGIDDSAWTLFVAGGVDGFVIIDRDNPSGTLPAAGDEVEVYPAQAHRPAMENSTANAQQAFMQKFAVTADYDAAAVVTT